MNPNTSTSLTSIKENFQLRGNSFKEGMYLLVDSLKNTELKKFIEGGEISSFLNNYKNIVENIDKFYEKYESNQDSITSFEEGKQNLNSLLSSYKQLLQENSALEGVFQSLCEAERYSVWKKGRETIDTGVIINQFEITQQEIPLHDSEFLTEEYKKINDEVPPCWFKCLATWQQGFIKAHQATLLNNVIPSSLRSVPGLANLSKHNLMINGVEKLSYFRHATPRPVDLMNYKHAYDEEYRITCLNIASQIRLSLNDQFKHADRQIREAVILTQSLLSPGTAAYLKSKVISGASDNDTEIYKIKEEVVELFQCALSHPNDFLDKKHDRLKALFFSETSLNQTIYYKDFLAKWSLEVQSEGLFKYKTCDPLKITLLSTNHPLNILRRFGVYPEQTTRNENNTGLLLGAVGRFLKPIFEEYSEETCLIKQLLPSFNQLLRILSKCEEEKTVLESDKQIFIKILDDFFGVRDKFDENTQCLFCALQMLFSTPLDQGGWIDKDVCHNQLMISSAEALILHCIRGSLWVACKSGKDRTGIASAAYDAAQLYFNEHKKLPACQDGKSDKTAYATLLKELFESGHHQKAAAENALGAKGIVEPGMILPADVQLDACQVRLNTALARLNKPSDPGKPKIMDFFMAQKTSKTKQDEAQLVSDIDRYVFYSF